MKKGELLKEVSKKIADQKLTNAQLNATVKAVFDTLGEAICSTGRVAFPDFGTFTVKERAARDGRNPRTKETIKIPASKGIGFKVSPKLKAMLNVDMVAADKADAKVADKVEEKKEVKADKKAADKKAADKKATKKAKK